MLSLAAGGGDTEVCIIAKRIDFRPATPTVLGQNTRMAETVATLAPSALSSHSVEWQGVETHDLNVRGIDASSNNSFILFILAFEVLCWSAVGRKK